MYVRCFSACTKRRIAVPCRQCSASLHAVTRGCLRQACESLRQKKSAFYTTLVPERDRDFHWLAPDIVAEVSFLEWTPSGQIRLVAKDAVRAPWQRSQSAPVRVWPCRGPSHGMN
ncbi:hypothetical protein [Caballeronia sp. GAWG1-1]|uniref:ATP dependent DNA ligase n=1 Tax=Caballeronia sp. GAWG1-1 TaxID=2921742 RepID=UPI0032EE47BD